MSNEGIKRFTQYGADIFRAGIVVNCGSKSTVLVRLPVVSRVNTMLNRPIGRLKIGGK